MQQLKSLTDLLQEYFWFRTLYKHLSPTGFLPVYFCLVLLLRYVMAASNTIPGRERPKNKVWSVQVCWQVYHHTFPPAANSAPLTH